jgi:hypothetical protein
MCCNSQTWNNVIINKIKILFPHPLHNEKIGKPNNLKVFRRKRTKAPKQNSQSRLMAHMTEGMREENLKFINNYIIPDL